MLSKYSKQQQTKQRTMRHMAKQQKRTTTTCRISIYNVQRNRMRQEAIPAHIYNWIDNLPVKMGGYLRCLCALCALCLCRQHRQHLPSLWTWVCWGCRGVHAVHKRTLKHIVIHIGKYCVVEPVGMPAHTASEDSIKWQAAIKGSSYACFQPANADMPHIVTIQ